MLVNRNPLDLTVSSYLTSTSGILGVAPKYLRGSMDKIGCEDDICKFVQSCPSFLGAGRGGREPEIFRLRTLDSAVWLRR